MIKAFYENTKLWSRKGSSKSAFEKIKISFFSIIIGFIFGSIILGALKYNPFEVYSTIFKGAFKDSAKVNQLLIFTSIFTLSGLGNAVAFKTGLFNIGISGQMLAGGAVSMLLGLTILKDASPAVAIPLLLIVAVIVGTLVGLLVGLLKSKLNVHEVVSTILLNWIIFYVIKFIFRTSQSFIDPSGNSRTLNRSFRFGGATGDNRWVAMIIISLILCAAIWAIFKYTTFGKKLKITGMNKDASHFSGINVSLTTISSLVISAGIAGVLGFVYYIGYKHFVPALQKTLPTEGFDGIAIALLSFSSPIAVPFMALFYSIFLAGTQLSSLPSQMQQPIISLIFSIIIYLAAASSLFIRFKPIEFAKWMFAIKNDKEVKNLLYERREKLNEYNLKEKLIKIKSDTKISKDEMKEKIMLARFARKNIINDYSLKINRAYSEFNVKTIDYNYKTTWAYPKNEINNYYKELRSSIFIDFYNKTKSLNDDELKNLKEEFKKKISGVELQRKEKIKNAYANFKVLNNDFILKSISDKNDFINELEIQIIGKAVK